MSSAKKTDSMAKSILGILLAVVLLTTACPITSFAAGDNQGVMDAFPALGVSSDTMNVNNGTINTLYGGGNVKDNKGTIFSSRGTVNENHGTIESLIAGNVGTNYKTINRIENTGLLGVNDEGGTVGFVGMGNDIGRNYGTIQETAGLIGRNDGTIGENTGTVNHNYGTVSSNKGTVYMHSGCVGKNEKSGVVLVENTGEADIYINQNEGSVKISSGYVEIEGNTGNIEITNAYVYVGENYGNITLGAGAALEFDANMSDGVITKTDKSASIIYGIADGRIVDETAAWYKIVFEGDDGKAVVKECDKEENGVYYTQSGSIVTFTLPSEYECSAGMIWESGNVNTWVMNADPAEGDTEFTISCHKCTPGNYWMTTEKHWQICAGCGKMLAETEGAHTFGEFVPNDDATCVKDGTETGKCTVCGYKRTRTAVDSHLTSDHHEHIVIAQRVEPTETSTGLTQGSHCEDCNKVLTAQEIIPKIPHTCVSSSDYLYDGSTHWKICSICNEKFDEETHNNGNLVLNTEATCTEKATYYMQCDICGAVDHTQIVAAGDPLGHNFVNYISDGNATCTADGTKTAKCDNCDATDTQPDVGSATGHSFTTYTSNNDATCTADGTKTATCANGCGVTDTVADTGSAKGHTYGEWTTTKEPTETETGSKERTCSVCGEKETEVLPVLSHMHKLTLVPVKDATDTEDGNKAYYICSCGKWFEDPDAASEIVDHSSVVIKAADPINSSKLFKDVKESSWFKKAVDFAVEHELMNGVSADTFNPNGTMTRAMLVTVLWRLDGSLEVSSSTPFTDLKQDWYKTAVAWAYKNEIVNGTAPDKFSPNGAITREQMAAILFRYSEYKGYDVSMRGVLAAFPDASDVHSYAADALSWAVGEGLIGGVAKDGKSYLDPRGSATRAQVATILQRYCEKY